MVTLKRISKQVVKLLPDSSAEYRIITKRLTFWVEGANWSKKFQEGFWDGKKRFFKNKNEIAFGLTKFVCDILDEEGIEWDLKDYDKFNPVFDLQDIPLSEGLRGHQEEATKVFFDNPHGPWGIAKVPTRGGKTFTAAECMRIADIIEDNTISVFMVDGIDLFNQTVEELTKFFDIPADEIGKLQGKGVWDFRKINVATIQTFSRILFPSKEVSRTVEKDGEKVKKVRKKTKQEMLDDKKKRMELEKLMRTVNFLIVDEVQEYSSDSRLGTIRKFRNLTFLLSLSATPFRSEDELGNIAMREVVGDVIYEVPEEELIESGSLVKNKVLIILYDDLVQLGDNYIDYYNRNIMENDARNGMILKIVGILRKLKLKSLFMITRKEHGHKLSKRSGVTFVSGDNVSQDRETIKKEFLEKIAGVLFASDIYKKGVSLNNVEVLVNVSGGKEKSAIIQKRGRILASVDGKSLALMIDIFDRKPYFSEHSENRLEAYIDKVGEENVIILEAGDSDFWDDFESIIEDYFHGT